MDPIAHTLFGAGMAQTGLGQRSRFGTATILIGANLPDLDGVAYFWGSDTALAFRRGWTHGILAMVVLPVVLVLAVSVFDRWLAPHRQRALSRSWLMLIACLAVWSHPLLDWLNTYGVRLLMPFDGRWFYGDTLFIVDPWLWLVLGGMLFLIERGRTVTLLLVLLALGASVLLFSSPLSPLTGRTVWLAGIVMVMALRAMRSVTDLDRQRIARITMGLVFAYLLVMMVGAMAARRLVATALRREGVVVESLMVGPLPVNPLRREVVAATSEEIRVGTFGWLDSPRFRLEGRSLPRPPHSPVVEAAIGASCVRGLVAWARFPFVEVERRAQGWEVFILDARYARRRTQGFGGGRVLLDDQLHAHCAAREVEAGR